MKLSLVVFFILLITMSYCNIWDNVYSQTNADTPIVVSESLNFQFELRDNLQAKIDFNSDLGVVTLFIYLNMLIKLQLVKAQLDLSSLIVTITRLNSEQCERYNIAALKNTSLDQTKINTERLFLINIFFKFIKKTGNNVKGQGYNIYKFQPFLFTIPQSSKLKQLQKQVNSQTNQDFDFQQGDFTPDIPLFVHVNSLNGNIQKIFTGEKQQTSVPFNTNSVVKAKMICKAQVHSMGTSDLKQIFEFIKEQQKN